MFEQCGNDSFYVSDQILIDYAAQTARRRLQRDIHDVAGQFLVGATFKIAALEQRIGDDDLKGRLIEIRQMIDVFEDQLRAIYDGRSAAFPQSQSLIDAMQDLISEWERNTQVLVAFTHNIPPSPTVGEATAEVVFRVVQEALTNVAKHARSASVVRIGLRITHKRLVLTVEDDGPGLSRAQPLRPGLGGRQNGIAGMRERVGELGGRLVVRSTVGEGTNLIASLPIGKDGP